MPAVYYNEIDPYAAQWLRNLIAAGHIAPGEVDERDIRDVRPDDLAEYTQCHFFAGIGVWSYALRRARWPDDRPVWTGSCPCQPFSAAGRGGGFVDERHLWPHWHHLIRGRRPVVVFGEQVASKDGLAWLDLVQADLEGEDYASGAVDLCAAGFGAPHIRQRLYFVAESTRERDEGCRHVGAHRGPEHPDCGETGLLLGGMADDDGGGRTARRQGSAAVGQRQTLATGCGAVELGDAGGARPQVGSIAAEQCRPLRVEGAALGAAEPVRGFWRGADWIFCRDGKYRPVEPGTFPLAHGAPARVGRLRAYGNAIVAEVAAEFVAAYLAGRSFGLNVEN